MAVNYGKKFEEQFKHDVLTLPNTLVLRLPDQQSGYYGTSQNICDFILFRNKVLYFVELKSIKGNTFPLSNFKQFNNMLSLANIDGVEKYLIIWYRDHARIIAVKISDVFVHAMQGNKSINVNKLDSIPHVEIPSSKKRVMLSSDYSVIFI